MEALSGDARPIPPTSSLLRRVHHFWWVEDKSVLGGRRLSSKAFHPDDTGSVSIGLGCVLEEAGQPPQAMLTDHPGMGLTELRVEQLATVDNALSVAREPTDSEPWHGVILGVRRRPKAAQKAIEDCLADLGTLQMLVTP